MEISGMWLAKDKKEEEYTERRAVDVWSYVMGGVLLGLYLYPVVYLSLIS